MPIYNPWMQQRPGAMFGGGNMPRVPQRPPTQPQQRYSTGAINPNVASGGANPYINDWNWKNLVDKNLLNSSQTGLNIGGQQTQTGLPVMSSPYNPLAPGQTGGQLETSLIGGPAPPRLPVMSPAFNPWLAPFMRSVGGGISGTLGGTVGGGSQSLFGSQRFPISRPALPLGPQTRMVGRARPGFRPF